MHKYVIYEVMNTFNRINYFIYNILINEVDQNETCDTSHISNV